MNLTFPFSSLQMYRFISLTQRQFLSLVVLQHSSTPSPCSTLMTVPTSSSRNTATWWSELVAATRLSASSHRDIHTQTNTHELRGLLFAVRHHLKCWHLNPWERITKHSACSCILWTFREFKTISCVGKALISFSRLSSSKHDVVWPNRNFHQF